MAIQPERFLQSQKSHFLDASDFPGFEAVHYVLKNFCGANCGPKVFFFMGRRGSVRGSSVGQRRQTVGS